MSVQTTGKYRVIKSKFGYSGGRTELITGTESEVEAFIQKSRDILEIDGYKLLTEEEVIYKNSLKDESGNFVDSAPVWRVKLF